MPPTQHRPKKCTRGAVHTFAANIPEELRPCREERHDFKNKAQAVALDRNGERTKDAKNVTQIEYIDICARCGLRRHHIYILRSKLRTDLWYSNWHPDLRAPAGVRATGINVRREIQRAADERAAEDVLRKLSKPRLVHSDQAKGTRKKRAA